MSLPTRHLISRLGASDSRRTNVPTLWASVSQALFSTWRKVCLVDVNSRFDDSFSSEDRLAYALLTQFLFDCSVTVLGRNEREAMPNGT